MTIKAYHRDKNKWLINLLPAIIITGFILTARWLGFLETWELSCFDWLLRLRPQETTDEKIVIIALNEEYIRSLQQYPIPDAEIANLIETIQQYQPRAIGLDLVRDIPVPPGEDALKKTLTSYDNIIGIEKILPPTIAPNPWLNSQQIGFADALPDDDGRLRRNLLGNYADEKKTDYRFSFALRLAEIYLAKEGFTLENGIKDKQTMRFGNTELPRFSTNFGGYVRQNQGGVQVLLNFRNAKVNFPVFPIQDLIEQKIEPRSLQDHLVLIGIMTSSVPDTVSTNAISSNSVQGEIYGIEFQAHAISQIINAILHQRPLIKSLPEAGEYLWIITWGIIGVYLSRLTVSPLKNLLAIITAVLILFSICYLLLWWGWWIPLIPSLLILVGNGIIMTSFYLAEQNFRLQLQERQQTIDYTFNTIHNGPLQSLAIILQNVRQNPEIEDKIGSKLVNLNQEIRDIGEYLKQEALNPEVSLRLGSGSIIDLQQPLHELFYEIFTTTLNRNLPHFPTIKIKIRWFAPLPDYLTLPQKKQLCQFLEESLVNVGKHAQGVTRIKAVGEAKKHEYHLTIEDNGTNPQKKIINQSIGTKQAQKLAQELGGKFTRKKLENKGVQCQLKFPLDSHQRKWLNPIYYLTSSANSKIHLRRRANNK